jgi:hypothetical protein
LDDPAGELDADRSRGAGEHRADEQDDPARGEDPPCSEQVRQASAQQQEAAEGDHVGIEHPGKVLLGEAEILLDARQRYADDRRVHDHHELRRRDENQSPPTTRGRRGPRCLRHRNSSYGQARARTADRLFDTHGGYGSGHASTRVKYPEGV